MKKLYFIFLFASLLLSFDSNGQEDNGTEIKKFGFYQKRITNYGIKNEPIKAADIFILYNHTKYRYQYWWHGGSEDGQMFVRKYKIGKYTSFEYGTVYQCTDMYTNEYLEITLIQHPEKGNLISVKKGKIDTDYFDAMSD